jgi:hypothetical protein
LQIPLWPWRGQSLIGETARQIHRNVFLFLASVLQPNPIAATLGGDPSAKQRNEDEF